MKSIFEVYNTWTPPGAKGWKMGEFRTPKNGEWYLAASQGQVALCADRDDPHNAPRFILEAEIPTKNTVYASGYTIPSGYIKGEFRNVCWNEQYLSKDGRSRKEAFCYIPDGPRIILRAPTIEDVYGTPTPRIPAGFERTGMFRRVTDGEYFLDRGGTACFARPDCPWALESPRLILRPVQKTLRVVRVLEYVGPKDWIDKTLAKNYATPAGVFLGGGAQIRELSSFQEEVKP